MLIFQLNVYLCDFLHYTCSLTLILNMNRLIEVLIKIMLLFSLLVSLFLHCVVCVSKNSIGTYFPTPLTTQIHIPVDYSPTPLTTQIHIPVEFTYTSFHTNTHTSWVYPKCRKFSVLLIIKWRRLPVKETNSADNFAMQILISKKSIFP